MTTIRAVAGQLVALGWILASCVSHGTPATRSWAFVHVNVVPMNRECILVDHTVVVRGGRIDRVGPANEVDVPRDAVLIDGEHMFLLPGLADMHVHVEDDRDALLLFVANGVTTIRNMWGKPDHLTWREQVESGTLLGPAMFTTGPITDGDPPLWQGSVTVTTVESATAELSAQRAAGYDAMKVMTNLDPAVYRAILEASEKYDFPVYGHVPTRVGLARALGMGQRSFEHVLDFVYALLPEDSPQRVRVIEAYQGKYERLERMRAIAADPYRFALTERIPDLAARAAASDVWFCPTLIATHGFHIERSTLDEWCQRPCNQYVPRERVRGWQSMLEFQLSQFADADTNRRALEIHRLVVSALHRAGARLLAGTDTHPDMPFIVPGFSLHEELQNLVRCGLSPFEALRAATVEAAAALCASGEFGTIRPGSRADLLLLDGDPLVDVAEAANPVGVMVGGRWYPGSELQARLDALAKAYREREVEKAMEPEPDPPDVAEVSVTRRSRSTSQSAPPSRPSSTMRT